MISARDLILGGERGREGIFALRFEGRKNLQMIGRGILGGPVTKMFRFF